HRRVVDRGDREGHRGRGAVRLAIVGLVGKGHEAVVVGDGGVGEGAVGVEREGCGVRGSAYQHRRQRGAVNVRIVRQHPRCTYRKNGVFVRAVAVVHRHRGVVDRGDGDAHRGGNRGQAAVAGQVGKVVGAE